MKKKIGILALILAIAMCFFTISAFAGEDSGNSQMPFVDSEQISPEHPDVQTEADLMEDFEEIFGEGGAKIFGVSMVGALFMSLFLPALVVVIVFGVLNGKTKKKIKEYERFFGPVPQKMPNTYTPTHIIISHSLLIQQMHLWEQLQQATMYLKVMQTISKEVIINEKY